MAKIALQNLDNLQNESTTIAALNNNNALIREAVDNTLSRNGVSPNQMNAPLDMNSNKIINLLDATTDQEPVTLGQMDDAIDAISQGAVINASFITVDSNPTLLNERVLTGGSNVSVTDNGPGSPAGSIVVDVSDPDLNAIAGLSTTGLISRTGAGTVSTRTITGTANEVTVANGDGVAGDPTVSLPSALTFTGKTVTGGSYVTPALGTPASGVMTNVTGLPISTGVSGLGTNVATFLATPSSANLASAMTDETGTGANVFATSPTLVTPVLGTPTSGTLTNCTGLPLSGLANQAAYTIVANNTGSSAAPTAMDVPTITSKATPVSGDIVLIQDSAASNAFKRTTVGAIGTASAVSSIAGNTGAFTLSHGLTNSTNDLQIDVPTFRGYLSGLTISMNSASSNFTVGPGVAADGATATPTDFMRTSTIDKSTSAWAVGGSNHGALDTGTIAASTWYHVYLMKRPDTGVVDVAISTSAVSPATGGNIPVAYTLFRRIGSIKTDGSSQWTLFHQLGDEFLWDVSVLDVNAATLTTASRTLYTLSVPPGVQVNSLFNLQSNLASSPIILTCPEQSDQTGGYGAGAGGWSIRTTVAGDALASHFNIRTDTSARIGARSTVASKTFSVMTMGWIDTRGKLF